MPVTRRWYLAIDSHESEGCEYLVPTAEHIDEPLDSRLLAAAAETALPGHGRSIDWSIFRRMDRRYSTVYELKAFAPTVGGFTAFYKIHRQPQAAMWMDTERYLGELESALRRAPRLVDLLNRGQDLSGITAAPILACDPEQLVLVTLGMSGVPLAKMLSSRNPKALGAVMKLGAACRLIDNLKAPGEAGASAEGMTWLIDFYLDRFSLPSGHSKSQLSAHLKSLLDGALQEANPISYCHGDLLGGNVLVATDRIGLIDFRWAPRTRGYDLAHSALRIKYKWPWTTSWGTRLTKALLDGYGDPTVIGSPGWELVEVMFLIRRYNLSGGAITRRFHRATSESALRALLNRS